MNARARNFLAANELSPVVYGSVEEGKVTYRLENGQTFRLSVVEAREAPHPRWAHLEREMGAAALAEHLLNEAQTLVRVLAEARG